MDLNKYEFVDGEWISIEVKSDRILEPFRFKVQPITESMFRGQSKSPEGPLELAMAMVVDWEFALGEEPLPCTMENKQKYLPRFGSYLVKSVNGEPAVRDMTLAAAIMEFSGNPDNFLKN